VITLRRKSGPAAALGLVVAGLLAGASAASANSVNCEGITIPKTPKSSTVNYRFACSEEIKSFSIVSNIEVGEFSTEVLVLDPNTGDPASGQSFSCEGQIPGQGFGCSGYAVWANHVTGDFSLDGRRCIKGRNQFRSWVVVVDMNNTASGPYPMQSTSCPKPAKPARKARSRR
jgi:hypothetical protein